MTSSRTQVGGRQMRSRTARAATTHLAALLSPQCERGPTVDLTCAAEDEQCCCSCCCAAARGAGGEWREVRESRLRDGPAPRGRRGVGAGRGRGGEERAARSGGGGGRSEPASGRSAHAARAGRRGCFACSLGEAGMVSVGTPASSSRRTKRQEEAGAFGLCCAPTRNLYRQLHHATTLNLQTERKSSGDH